MRPGNKIGWERLTSDNVASWKLLLPLHERVCAENQQLEPDVEEVDEKEEDRGDANDRSRRH